MLKETELLDYYLLFPSVSGDQTLPLLFSLHCRKMFVWNLADGLASTELTNDDGSGMIEITKINSHKRN
jgi:hypothetical protein